MALATRINITSLLIFIWTVSAQNVGPFPNRQSFFNQPFNTNNQLNTPYVPILSYSNERNTDGSYRYSFSTADGKQAEESGFLKDVSVGPDGEPQGVQVVQGSYSYTAPDGTLVEVSYIADENGFQPTSANLPSNGVFANRNLSRFDPNRLRIDRYNPYNPSFNNPIYNQYNRFNNPYRNNGYYNGYAPRSPPYNQFGRTTTQKPRDNNN